MPSILSVSKDPMLLRTREQVLRTEGYEVVSADSVERALALLGTSELPDLVLLGHTLTTQEKISFEVQFRKTNLSTPILDIRLEDRSIGMVRPNYFELSGSSPEQLLSACKLALQKGSSKTAATD